VRALATTTTVDGGKQRKKLVVLGNGWAGYRLILDVDISKYELSVISPRYPPPPASPPNTVRCSPAAETTADC
jgi:hypothetical protein